VGKESLPKNSETRWSSLCSSQQCCISVFHSPSWHGWFTYFPICWIVWNPLFSSRHTFRR
jgi:hypothetical protein